jgi:ABC-2 type transport system ATP-binding protein
MTQDVTETTQGPVIDVKDAVKAYPTRGRRDSPPAVGGVTMQVAGGEIVALLGRNGAGKSTLVKMMCTLVTPTSGSISIAGHDVVRDDDAARRQLGVVLGGERSLYWKLTGRQNLRFFASLRGLRGRAARAAVTEALERVDLADRADDYAENYSTGMRQRLIIARALLGNPRAIIMDEPTSGLDPHATASLQDLITSLRGAGHGILITTHHIEEAEAVADRVAIIDQGRLIAEDRPAALVEGLGATRTFSCTIEASRLEGQLQELITELDTPVEVIARRTSDDGLHHLTLGGRFTESFSARFITRAIERDWQVHSLRAEPVSLRHVFLSLTGRDIEHEDGDEGDDDDDD